MISGLTDPPVEETLRFKIGAQIMMLNNDQFDRWVNGTLARVTAARMDDGLVVTVEFADGDTADVRPFTWEATTTGGRRRVDAPRGDWHL